MNRVLLYLSPFTGNHIVAALIYLALFAGNYYLTTLSIWLAHWFSHFSFIPEGRPCGNISGSGALVQSISRTMTGM